MAEITLVAERRETHGSAATRRLRTSGNIPGVVYGHGVEPIAVTVEARALRSALSSEAGVNALFDIDVDGTHHLAIARELQRHPVRQTVSHVDFQVVRRDEVVPADVPVNLIGEALNVTRAGGSIEHLILNLHIRAKPGDIPVAFEVDISELEIGNSLRVGDIGVPAGVTIEADDDTAVVIAHPPRAVATGEELAEGEPTAEATEVSETPAESSVEH